MILYFLYFFGIISQNSSWRRCGGRPMGRSVTSWAGQFSVNQSCVRTSHVWCPDGRTRSWLVDTLTAIRYGGIWLADTDSRKNFLIYVKSDSRKNYLIENDENVTRSYNVISFQYKCEFTMKKWFCYSREKYEFIQENTRVKSTRIESPQLSQATDNRTRRWIESFWITEIRSMDLMADSESGG